MNKIFTVSKNILGFIDFDKEHQLWRVCSLENQVFDYNQVKKVSIIEELQKHKRTANILNNLAATASGAVAFGQSSAYTKVQIKVTLTDNSFIVFDISKDYLMLNTLEYYSDKRKAEEVKQRLKILERRNKQ